MKFAKTLALISFLALGVSCAHHKGSCCETKCGEGKQCSKDKESKCKDGQCDRKKDEEKKS